MRPKSAFSLASRAHNMGSYEGEARRYPGSLFGRECGAIEPFNELTRKRMERSEQRRRELKIDTRGRLTTARL